MPEGVGAAQAMRGGVARTEHVWYTEREGRL